MKDRGPKWMPMMYVNYFGILQKLAMDHGYALCVHGSVVRDFDLVCVPFDEIVSPHHELLAAIRMQIGLAASSDPIYDKVGYEPHGRTCYTIECGSTGYFDISFTPSMLQAMELIKEQSRKREEMEAILETIRNIEDSQLNIINNE
jgi:hypothetical protein